MHVCQIARVIDVLITQHLAYLPVLCPWRNNAFTLSTGLSHTEHPAYNAVPARETDAGYIFA